MITIFEKVEKESIVNLVFPDIDVLTEAKEILQRESDLKRALSLGNLEHAKIKIYFEDSVSKKTVETTVWGITDKRILLKKGLVIPIHRVYKIE